MCGICGYVGTKIDEEVLTRMNDSLSHRGPNDSGILSFTSGSRSVGIAHRRLAILDLSELGHQPMKSDSGKTVVAFNGEIYNYREIRNELIKKGYSFRSNCDTEVIVYAYEVWGIHCFDKFNGMFAVAICDINKKEIVLARDRFGKKPLYYYYYKGEFVFGSELKPIMLHPFVEKKINRLAICKYFCNKYIESPLTIFENTYKVKPGELVIFNYEAQIINKTHYYDLTSRFNDLSHEKKHLSLSEAETQLDGLLCRSVQRRLISDVPVGIFLSGGIDSSLVAAIAQRLSGKRLDSFTIGFYDKKKNEATKAKKIAEFIGTKHHEYYLSDEEAIEIMDGLIDYYDEPFSDDSQLPSMMVSKIASESVTVALTGDGGDELFCGYKEYDLEWIAQHADFIGDMLYRMPRIGTLLGRSAPEIRAFINNRDPGLKSQLFADVFLEEANKLLLSDYSSNIIKYDDERKIRTGNLQEKRMVLDMLTYLPDEILCKMDRASMRYSLEVRCPLLDYNIAEWTFGIDHSMKYNLFRKKYLLKNLAYKYVQKDILAGPKKGFGVPKARWLRDVFSDEITKISSKNIIESQEIFDYSAIQKLILHQRESNRTVYTSLLWSFYIFQKWYNRYMERIL